MFLLKDMAAPLPVMCSKKGNGTLHGRGQFPVSLQGTKSTHNARTGYGKWETMRDKQEILLGSDVPSASPSDG